jgi:hypothetical protein
VPVHLAELTTVWHLGFVSVICRIPYDNLGIAVLTNDMDNGGNIMEVIKFRLLDEALGMTPIDWNSRFALLLSSHPREAFHNSTESMQWQIKLRPLPFLVSRMPLSPPSNLQH